MTKFIKFSIPVFFLPAFGTLKAQPTAENINRILLDEMKREHIPGAQLTILYNNKICYSKAVGLANVEFSVPVTDSTLFSINSIAKVFAEDSRLCNWWMKVK